MNSRRRNLKFAATFLAIVFVAALIFARPALTHIRSTPQSTPQKAEVRIDNFAFTPATITVAAGTTVIFTNGDDIPHTVVSADRVFKSKALDTGDTFSNVFTKPGKYPYFCSIHPRMTGEVIVK